MHINRWFARLLLEGQVFAAPGVAVSAQCVRELRGALGKSKLRDGSAAVVTQMKPIPKVSDWFLSPRVAYVAHVCYVSDTCLTLQILLLRNRFRICCAS
jgi:hypothetical protein